MVVSLSAWAPKNLRRVALVRGKNPRKQNAWVGKPDAPSADMPDDAPGTGTTSCPADSASQISGKPGSDTPGVPASVTNATSPSANRSTRWVRRVGEVNSWKLASG